MEISIILTTLFSIFANTADLCADVHVNAATGQPVTDSHGQTLARFCKWTGPQAPTLAADVCCIIDDAAACWLPDANGRCTAGVKRYCKYGEVNTAGGVVCLQPLPDACAAGYCVDAPAVPPPTEALVACCMAGGCHLITTEEQIDSCTGSFVTCSWGQTNTDGTVSCYDD